MEEPIPGLRLLVGDLKLSTIEDDLASQWPACLDGKERAFRVLTALWRILDMAATRAEATLVLLDVGPNLGAFNRAALVASDYIVIPLAPDLYSLQGLRNLGPTLREWRKGWSERRSRNPVRDLSIPQGSMTPIGYVVMQHAVRLDQPWRAHSRCMKRIPTVYAQAVKNARKPSDLGVTADPDCLAILKNFQSLLPLAQDARKPMFALKPADGAIGGHANAVSACYLGFRDLAYAIAERVEVRLP